MWIACAAQGWRAGEDNGDQYLAAALSDFSSGHEATSGIAHLRGGAHGWHLGRGARTGQGRGGEDARDDKRKL